MSCSYTHNAYTLLLRHFTSRIKLLGVCQILHLKTMVTNDILYSHSFSPSMVNFYLLSLNACITKLLRTNTTKK